MMSISNTQRSQLYTLITVFFFWGFIAASNGIFIPFCKQHFGLNQFQSQLIDLTFYGGYFFGSLFLLIYSRLTGFDLINKIGYKKGIILGLIISTIGALCIVPAVNAGSFGFILGSFCIVALGFSLQQTSAQPYAVNLGSAQTGAHRLNLAGGINSLGATLGPIIVSYLLFGELGNSGSASLSSVKSLYFLLAGIFIVMAVFFILTGTENNTEQKNTKQNDLGALRYPQLTLGMVAIFVYVGVEVTIQSNMGALLKLPEFGGFNNAQISPYISLYWGSLMIGRWMAAISAFDMKGNIRHLLSIIVPFIAFGLVLFVNYLNKNDISNMYWYALPILAMIAINFLTKEKQTQALIFFSLFGLIAMLVGMMCTGQVALYAFISGGLACSVLWPCIFSVAINGLGEYTSQGSSFLIMMIVGGAVIPPMQGFMADQPEIGIHASYIITVFCFLYLAFYGLKVRSILHKQGLKADSDAVTAH